LQRAEQLVAEVLSLARWIHIHRQPNDLLETINFAMPTQAHHLTDPSEFVEVMLLARDQWICSEMRYHY
jgi:hypothetical protein